MTLLAIAALIGSPGALASASASEAFHIESRFVRRVETTLSTSVGSPKTVDGALTVYAPIPPNLATQKMVACAVRCREREGLISTTSADLNDPNQRYMRLDIPVDRSTFQGKVTVDMTYTIDLFSARLVRGSGAAPKVRNAVDLEPYLSESSLFDHKSPAFRAWLKDKALLRTSGESNLAFGYRAFKYLSEHGKPGHFIPFDQAKASLLCRDLTGDCGGMTVLFASICRANGVPVRPLIGRWAYSEVPGYGQFHVNQDLYDPQVGWIPVDMAFATGAVQNHDDPDLWYGWSEGKLVVFTVAADSCPSADSRAPLDQFMLWTYKGSSPFEPKWEDHWTASDVR